MEIKDDICFVFFVALETAPLYGVGLKKIHYGHYNDDQNLDLQFKLHLTVEEFEKIVSSERL